MRIIFWIFYIFFFFHIHSTSFYIQICPNLNTYITYISIYNLCIIILNNSSKYISAILRTFGSRYFTYRFLRLLLKGLSKNTSCITYLLSVVDQLRDFLWKKLCEVLLAIDYYVSTESYSSRVTFRVDHTQYREFVSGLLNIMPF